MTYRPRYFHGKAPIEFNLEPIETHLCGQCAHLGDRKPEKQIGYCLERRCMVPSTVLTDCTLFVHESRRHELRAAPKASPAPAAGELYANRHTPGIQPAERPGPRDTSMQAYRALERSGRLSKQQQRVMDFIHANPQRDFTRQELSSALELGINVICGRVNELMREPFQLLVETGRRECRITGEMANSLRARVAQPELELT